ncbi:MAG: molybdopterin-dependent oxidoreductase [Rhodobacteraceae bacterium]|nr:molybdopterin-dependent oxidoreductase [Paracoccaceae bacterium]
MGEAANRPIKTACPYCGVGCGVLATSDGQGGAAISGDPSHPANYGRLCSKGAALGETLDLDGRLLWPTINGARAGWPETTKLIADKFTEAVARYGPDSVAFYVSGQLLTEDYYVANKLMKGFIGSGNIDTNSRLCMASSVAGHKRAFGADTVPGVYEDLELADLIVLVGSNLAWCHPVLHQRITAAKEARPHMRVVNIDPRRTATSDLADIELQLSPGSDVALFNGLLRQIDAEDALDEAYVSSHVEDISETIAAANVDTIERTAEITELAPELLKAFYRLWIDCEKVVTIYSQGVNQSSAGTDKVNAIINCHLATGRIGRPGMGPFSVTGQPNAMGGREVGGLANMLAAHLDIDNASHRAEVQTFWRSPTICSTPGLKAVDLFKACGDGRVKALWIMSTNPAVSLPEADSVAAAIRNCPFVVVSDIVAETDTTALADVLLPATGWGEKDGTVTNSERRISRQRAFLSSPGETRPDWRIICDVAAAMGWHDAFNYDSPAAIFREHAALSKVAERLGLDFDISAYAEISNTGYDALQPFHWPANAANRVATHGYRFFQDGGFFTKTRRGRMVPVSYRPPARVTSQRYPLRLNTGRVRDHWHTMTRTAKAARLSSHMAEPYVEIHPADAKRSKIDPATLVTVESPFGAIVARALITDRTPEGLVFCPMHWTNQWSSKGRVDAVLESVTDPISGQPESKAAPIRLSPFEPAWHGFAVARREFRPATAYWARAKAGAGWRAEMAGAQTPEDWIAYAQELFNAPAATPISVFDRKRGLARIALLEEERVIAALYSANNLVEIARSHVIGALNTNAPAAAILAARPGAEAPDPGATVCACFDVGVNTILTAISEQNLTDVEAIGSALRAGSNCGSCRPELRALLARATYKVAAE